MHAALLVLSLLACNRPASGYLVQGVDVTVSPAALDFAAVPYGTTAALPLTLTNAGTDAASLALSVDGPFTLASATATLDPGATTEVDVRYAATSYAAASGAVTLTWTGADPLVVMLTATTNPDSDGDGEPAIDAGGADCDDTDATVHPGAADTCYDHVDQDCDAGGGEDPEEVDCDGDGVRLDAGDCDDEDAGVYPGAPEVSADLIDQDCDGMRDEDDRAPGDLVFSELALGSGGWLELCNATGAPVPVDGFTISWTSGAFVLPAYTAEAGACFAICERLTADCAFDTSYLKFDPSDLTIELNTGSVAIDRVEVDSSWGWASYDVASLDGGSIDATANDDRRAWCDTHGSPGATNPACP